MTSKKRLLPILVAVLMVFAMMPMSAGTVFAASGDPVVGFTGVLGTGVNTDNAQTVYYGVNGENPVAWRVIKYKDKGNTYIENQDDTMTLFAADNLISGVQFATNGQNDYVDSDLKSVVDGMYSSLFSSQERSAIESRTLGVNEYVDQEPYSTGVSGTETSCYLWPLSTAEALTLPSDFRSASGLWWLRSPGNHDDNATNVDADGFVYYLGNSVTADRNGVRPAFNLNLSSVLFTSAAAGGKSSGAVGADALRPISANSIGEWKLTVHDSSRDVFKASAATGAVLSQIEGYDSWSVPIACQVKSDDPYSVIPVPDEIPVPDDNDYVSVILADSEDNALYYGSIAKESNFGTKNVSIPTELAAGEYKLHVFYEKINGDKLTDYSSAFSTINLTVTAPPVTHTVTVNNGTGGGEYSEGENVTITANAPDTGMIFKKWTGADGLTFTEGNASTSTAIFTMPSEAVTLTATYKMDSSNYFVRITQEDGSEQLIELAGEPSDSIDAVMAKIQDKTGFPPHQQQLYYDGTFMEPGHTLADFGITKGDIIDLVLIHVTYTVTINSGTGSGNYVEGDAVTITANAPESGKKFKEWTGADGLTFTSGSAVTETATFTMPANDVTVTATYEDIPAQPVEQFTVTFDANGGSGSIDPVAIPAGEEFTVPECAFIPPEGKVFWRWNTLSEGTTGNYGTWYDPGDKITLTGDLTLYARWSEPMLSICSYDMTQQKSMLGGKFTDIHGWGDPSYGCNNYTVQLGDEYSVTAVPDDGYEFVGWYKGEYINRDTQGNPIQDAKPYLNDDNLLTNDPTYVFKVNGNTVLCPVFKKSETEPEPEPQPAAQTITASNVTKTYGNAAFSLGAKTNGDGTLTYKSSNTKVATVSSAGKVTIKGAGTAKITISASATVNYKAASKTITVTVKQAANPLKISPKTASVKYKKLKKKEPSLVFVARVPAP